MLENTYQLISKELLDFDEEIKSSLRNDNEDFSVILEYFFSTSGKKIRPTLGILLSLMLGKFEENQNKFLQAIELIHNATLFHDDVIDEASVRRNKETINYKYSNKIAILTGDYFLSCALKKIAEIESPKINKLFADCITQICEGELEQDLSLYKILTLEKYLEKTKRKTALLFSLALEGVAILTQNPTKENILYSQILGENFGMLFQIRDDLKNFETSSDKPIYNDLENGIFTAPIIYLNQEHPEVKNLLENKQYDKVSDLLKNSNAINQTKTLLGTFYDKAIAALDNFSNNDYKIALKTLLSYFRDN